MRRRSLLALIVFMSAIVTMAGCGTSQKPAGRAMPPTITPAGRPSPEANFAQPPSGLWRAAVPPEAIETLQTLKATGIPQRDLIDIKRRLNDPGQPIPQVARDEPWRFEIGDSHLFWVMNWDTHESNQVAARLVYETPHSYIFVEEGVRLNEDELQRLADRFEAQTYPTVRRFFGEEWSPGVDGDPHVTILFARKLGDGIGGYQRSMDEYSKQIDKTSNEMEIFYLGALGGGLDDDCLLAHEFEHIVQWAVDRDEATWLNEGLAELACQVCGFDSAATTVALPAIARQPDVQLNSWRAEADSAPAQYGASYLFVAYFLDRFGEQATQALAAKQENGLEGVDAVLKSFASGIDSDDVFADWIVANYINDPSLADGQYSYKSLVPPSFEAEVNYGAGDLPVERQTSVSQYGADYIVLRGEGKFQVDFAGATLVGLAPQTAHSGQYVWWGGRRQESDATLTREFDLSGLQQATLTFYAWYDIDEGYDYAFVELSTDSRHWTTLPGQKTALADPDGLNYGPGYTGSSSGWVQEKIDLTPFAGQKVQVRFEYLTDDGPLRDGIFLDDIEIPEMGYRDDTESNAGGWTTRGFSRIAPLLPQEWLLQLVTQRPGWTAVERLQLEPNNSGRWVFDLGPGETAVLIVSGRTRVTTEPADYWYVISAGPA